MPSQFEEDAFAEAAAISMAMTKAIAGLVSLSDDKRPYISRILEAGLHDLEEIDYRNVPIERRAALREKVKARYTEFITTIPVE